MIRTMLGLAALLALPAVAQAQNIDVRVVTRPGLPNTDLPLSLTNTPIGQEECRNANEIQFRLTGLPDTNRIDIWWGSQCGDAQRRGNTNVEGCEFIRNIELPTGAVSQRTLTLTAREIVEAATRRDTGTGTSTGNVGGEADAGAPDAGTPTPTSGACTGFSSEEQVFFLASEQAMSTTDVDAWGAIEVAIDTSQPDPPSNVSAGTGERQIPVSWNLSPSGGILRYRIYWDGNVNADCESGLLEAGSPVPDVAELNSEAVDTPTTDEVTLTSPIPVNTQAAVAVVAIDRAYNQSVASNVDCLVSIHTEGFWDLYKGEGGMGEEGCSIGALTPERAGLLSLLTLALGLLLLRRRRLG